MFALALAFAVAGVSQADSVTYNFVNFEGPGSGTSAGSGTNMNGIANSGAAVGFAIDNAGNLTNFIRNPDGSYTPLNINGSNAAMALGINSPGNVVGTVNGTAFYLPSGGSAQTLSTPAGASSAFGINDGGNIVGQYSAGGGTPGFFLPSHGSTSFTTINAPSGSASDAVNAQGVNNNGLVVGFYQGNDGQAHGFDAQIQNATSGAINGTPIADPTIPNVAGEPGATFVFSQILGINDQGIAVGYYGDSTTSQHGFLYNTNTGQYTFLDDPMAAFDNGVEITQITGINNAGDITGFYSNADGVFGGFVATPTPEPSDVFLIAIGVLAICLAKRRLQRAGVAS